MGQNIYFHIFILRIYIFILRVHIENADRAQVTQDPYTALEPVEGSATHDDRSSRSSSSEQGEQGEREEGEFLEGAEEWAEEEVQSQPDVPVDVPVERAEQLTRAHAEGDDDAAPVDVDFF